MPNRKLAIVMYSRLQKHGSFEDFMIWMARQARKENWEIHFLFQAAETPAIVALLEAEQAKVAVVPESWKSSAGAKALISKLAEIRPAVANFHFCENLQMVRVLARCRLMGTRVVTHYHGEIKPLHQLRWKNKHLSMLRLLSFFTNRIVTVSHANERFLHAVRVAAPVDMIYNGIDTAGFRQKAEAMVGAGAPARSGDGAVRFLYIGQLIDRKKLPVLIEAFSRVRQKFPNAVLTIIGGGPEEQRCRELAQKADLGSGLRFIGLLKEYPFDELSQSDVFVSASESESFGLVFTEAMCMRLPVIACEVGGIPEVVLNGKTGLLVPPNDTEALAAAMMELAGQADLRKRFGQAGYDRVMSEFDLRDKVESILQAFARLAGSPA